MEQHESYHKRIHDLVQSKELLLTEPELLLPQADEDTENLHDSLDQSTSGPSQDVWFVVGLLLYFQIVMFLNRFIVLLVIRVSLFNNFINFPILFQLIYFWTMSFLMNKRASAIFIGLPLLLNVLGFIQLYPNYPLYLRSPNSKCLLASLHSTPNQIRVPIFLSCIEAQ